MFKYFLAVSLFVPLLLSGQVNISQYADPSLFEVKPIIAGQDYEEETESSQAQWLQTLLQPGFDSLDNEKPDGAIAFFSTLKDQYPELPQPVYLIGAIEFERSKYKLAKEAFRSALQIDPLYLQSKFMYGLSQMKLSEIKEGEKTMKELLQFPAYQAQAYYGLGLIKLSESPPDLKAHKMFEKSIEKDSLFLLSYQQLAMYYYYSDRSKKAISVLNTAISLDPQWQEAILTRALISSRISSTSLQVEEDLNLLVELEPTHFYYRLLRGYFFIELGNASRAVEDIHTSLKLKSDVPAKGYRRRSNRIDDRELKELLDYYAENKSEISEEAQKDLNKGICQILQKNNIWRYSNVPTEDFELAGSKTENPAVDYFAATVYRINDDKKAAIVAYSRLMKKDTSLAELYLVRGELYEALQEYDSAYRDYSTFIDKNEQSLLGYHKRAQLSYTFQNYENAYPDLFYLVSKNPYDFNNVFKRAVCANQLENYASSNLDLNTCIKHSHCETLGAYYVQHQNYLHMGDTIQSLISLDSASHYDSRNEVIHQELVELAGKLDSIRFVKRGYERLIKYGGNTFQWYYERGKWNYHQGNYQQAYFDMERLVEYNTKNGEVCYYFGQILLKIGREKEAQSWLKRAEKLKYSPTDE